MRELKFRAWDFRNKVYYFVGDEFGTRNNEDTRFSFGNVIGYKILPTLFIGNTFGD